MLSRVKIKEGIKFHGHLGPYLVLGLMAGECALNRLKCKKHFGLDVLVKGANKRPKSCLIDGLQLSTGATYGKGNIIKSDAGNIVMIFSPKESKQKLRLSLKKELVKKLDSLKGHSDSEEFALILSKKTWSELFDLKP